MQAVVFAYLALILAVFSMFNVNLSINVKASQRGAQTAVEMPQLPPKMGKQGDGVGGLALFPRRLLIYHIFHIMRRKDRVNVKGDRILNHISACALSGRRQSL